jgi:hypothetical protein
MEMFGTVYVGLRQGPISAGVGKIIRTIHSTMIDAEFPALNTTLIVVKELSFSVQ